MMNLAQNSIDSMALVNSFFWIIRCFKKVLYNNGGSLHPPSNFQIKITFFEKKGKSKCALKCAIQYQSILWSVSSADVIIRPESDHGLPLSVTQLLSRLEWCDPGDVKIPTQNFVTVAVVDAEKRVDDSLVQIWKPKFGHKRIFCSDFEHKVWLRFWR